MDRYVVELPFPGAGALYRSELAAIARRAQRLTVDLGPGIQWDQTYLGDDRAFVVYIAEDEALVRDHIGRLGLEDGAVVRVTAVIDPTTDAATT